MHSELVVLGGGPGGYAAAFFAADEGMDVTLVEADPRLGGTCLLRGCIPSKALLHVAKVISEVEELESDWGVSFGSPQVAVDKVRAGKEGVIKNLTRGLASLAKARKVKVIQARGVLDGAGKLRLEGDHSSIPDDAELTFNDLIIATGSTPAMPPMFKIGSDRVMDSTGALDLADVPERLLVIGGGYIGLEMGTVYAQLGSQVSVVEMAPRLLAGADQDLVAPLAKRLKTLFEDRIYVDTKVQSLAQVDDQIEAAFVGPGKYGSERYDRVLVSVGRSPNSRNLGLETTRIQLAERGFITADDQMRTAEPHIFAIGDVRGEPMLAHKASHEARVAVEAIAGKSVTFDKAAIPAVVFTDPEIAWAGISQQEADAAGVPYEVVSYPWLASGRAQALKRTEGLTKWLVDPESQVVIGCGIVGAGAGELIAEAVLAIEMRCSVRDITESIHPHPTLSETVMNAAEMYFGTATEFFKPKKGK